MAITFKTFIDIVPHVAAIRKPVLLRGRHGVGKSQVVYQRIVICLSSSDVPAR